MTRTPASKENSTNALAKQLAQVLSDTYVLAVKVHGYHWNVTGSNFGGLHAFFETQYKDLFEAADEIAERIRALGMMPDGSMDAFLQNTIVKEADAKQLDGKSMLKDLLATHQAVRERIKATADFAGEIDDLPSQDLMIGRMKVHDKALWMIRSYLA